ncbi:deoxyribonuclease V [Thiofaba sp. EF100]|jgi:deoxyribonuclease V|uniref:deoxyribonuclease V n=1 Tax=Thiofaba sp. EF100 TaxID=3121274 RepID=UPI0032215BF9
MRLEAPHRWDVTPAEAVEIQRELAARVLREGPPILAGRIAGVDVGFEAEGRTTRAAVAVLDMPACRVVETALARLPTRFPYVPGLLAFRELPAVLMALGQLRQTPELLMCDGQGIAHPRRLGIAAHLGVVTGLPSVGVGKTRLCGRHAEVPNVRGAWVPLEDEDEVIGAVLRTRAGVKPVYVSIGHRLGLEAAIASVMAAVTRYRLPAPIRAAHRLASDTGPLGPGMVIR